MSCQCSHLPRCIFPLSPLPLLPRSLSREALSTQAFHPIHPPCKLHLWRRSQRSSAFGRCAAGCSSCSELAPRPWRTRRTGERADSGETRTGRRGGARKAVITMQVTRFPYLSPFSSDPFPSFPSRACGPGGTRAHCFLIGSCWFGVGWPRGGPGPKCPGPV